MDERFTRTDSSATGNFLTDTLGSTLALTDNSASTLTSYTYDPFGSTTTSGSSGNTYEYSGRENDGTGVYFYRARYYSPTLQRFASEDPIGLLGGINQYAYVSASPLNFTGPIGLDKKSSWGNFTDANRCAASLSQSMSVAQLPYVPKVLGSNSLGDLAGLATGPEPGTDPVDVGLETFNQSTGLAADTAGEIFGTLAPRVGVGVAPSLGIPVSYIPGVYNPITAGEATVTLAGTQAGSFALEMVSGIGEAKLLWDAGVYVGALAVCSAQ
jgi:RHS repeat-associated protein